MGAYEHHHHHQQQQQQQDQATATTTAPLRENEVELVPDSYELHRMAFINLMKYLS
jgi:hypothetical protein